MTLTVKSIKSKDAGRRIAAIPRAHMSENGIEAGDYISIRSPTGADRAVAQAHPGYPEDGSQPVIRIGNEVREDIGVSIDQKVVVSSADVSTADEVTVALPAGLEVEGNIRPHILKKLTGKVVYADEHLKLKIGFGELGEEVSIFFTDTKPKGCVVLRPSTTVNIADDSLVECVPDEMIPDDTSDGGSGGTEDDSENVSEVYQKKEAGTAYEDVGGLSDEIEQVREMIEMPMQYPEVFQRLGIEPPKGVLLHGPPGTGKTMIAEAVANEVDASFHLVSGPEIMGQKVGESEERLREVFEEAEDSSPAIVFIDEIDSIAGDRSETDTDARQSVVGQMLTLMDGINADGDVVVIGATNRVDSIDPALRRGGRFDREIEIGVPDKEGREEILHIHTREMPTTPDVDIQEYAEQTHGYVGADLKAFTKEAAMNALRRIRPDVELSDDAVNAHLLNSLEVTDSDFTEAFKQIEPSAMREVFVEVPDVGWDDVGGLGDTKEQMQETVQWPLEYDFLYDQADIDGASGVLMYGPPGTGKTLMAKAVANESEANFISIDGPEIMSKWIGEAEERIREVFEKARTNSPAVIFFDEIDSIASQRGGSNNEVSERVVSQLLTEMDGMEALEQVTVIATTNRPDLVDDALRRHGRFDKEIEIGKPDREGRKDIFAVHTSGQPLADDVDLDKLADRTEGYVGADIEAICETAGMNAMREFIRNSDEEENLRDKAVEMTLTWSHFKEAINSVEPSVDEDTIEDYGLN